MQTIDNLCVDTLQRMNGVPAIAPAKSADGRHAVGTVALRQAVLTSLPLMLADIAAIAISTLLAALLIQVVGFSMSRDVWALLLPLCVSFMASCALTGLYPGVGMSSVVELRQACIASTLVFLVFLASTFLGGQGSSETVLLLTTAWIFWLAAVPLLRTAARSVCGRWSWWGQPVLIVGGGATGLSVYKSLISTPGLGLRPIGIADDPAAAESLLGNPIYLGRPEQALGICRQKGVVLVVVAMAERSREQILEAVQTCSQGFPHLLVLNDLQELPTLWNRARDCGGLSGVQVDEQLLLPLPQLMKRCLDLSATICGGILILPLIAVLSLLTKLSSPGPIFYSQERIGRDGRRFRAWKFRTMIFNADAVLENYLRSNPEYRAEWEKDHKLRKDPRVTAVGKFLRATSLDELPQIWNVLRGEMSLVGPRPIVDAEIAKYADRFALYTKVTPGITGLWQVSGRNNTTYAQRVQYDAYYVRNWSPWMDLYILARTVKVVLFREGAY
jgi:Undecaprenyl-phosphate galactose phosphotransferase WbaP